MTIQKQTFSFIGGYGRSRRGNISPERSINVYISEIMNNDSVPPALLGTPGLSLKSIVSQTNGRGGIQYNNNIYVVIGSSLYLITYTFNVVYIGTIGTANGVVEFATNNAQQVMLVDGANGYIYNTSTGVFVMITDPDFPLNPSTLCFMDSYFVTNEGDTRQWNISDPNNGLSWDALQAQNMSYGQDTVQSLRVLKGNLWVMGKYTIETWANPGTVTPLFPLVQNTNFRFQMGVAAPGSVVQLKDSLTWLSNDALGVGSVMMSVGGEPTPISDWFLDEEIQKYNNPYDATAYLFRENGHEFYALNFTADDHSWLFDRSTKYWSEQMMLDGSRHVVEWCGNINNINIAIGYNNGNVYQLDQDIYKNADEAIHRRRVTDRFIAPTLQILRTSAMVLDMQTGVCEPNTQPVIFLSVSKDSGRNFGPRIEIPLGNTGNYMNQLQALNLGINRDFVFALDFYENMDFVLRNAAIAAEVVGA